LTNSPKTDNFILVIILLSIVPALIIISIAVALVWYNLRFRRTNQDVSTNRLTFKFQYVILPVVIFILCAVISAILYNTLPGEVSYHFQTDGMPDGWIGRVSFVSIGLLLQLFFALLGTGIVFGVSKTGILTRSTESIIKPNSLLLFMGNLVAFPQIIIGFAMLDIFSYNAYQKHLMPLWLFAIIILIIVTIAFLGFVFFYLMKAWRQYKQ
jgi:uncharacterized membrane protein